MMDDNASPHLENVSTENYVDIQETLNKYKEILNQGKQSNYKKIFWTFWFLINSVILPAIIPVFISVPILFLLFFIERLVVGNWIHVPLIVYWVLAWIFFIDCIYICRWLTYMDIPIQPELDDASQLSQKDISNQELENPSLDIERSSLSPSNASSYSYHEEEFHLKNANATKQQANQTFSVAFNMAKRASLLMTVPSPSFTSSKTSSESDNYHSTPQTFSRRRSSNLDFYSSNNYFSSGYNPKVHPLMEKTSHVTASAPLDFHVHELSDLERFREAQNSDSQSILLKDSTPNQSSHLLVQMNNTDNLDGTQDESVLNTHHSSESISNECKSLQPSEISSRLMTNILEEPEDVPPLVGHSTTEDNIESSGHQSSQTNMERYSPSTPGSIHSVSSNASQPSPIQSQGSSAIRKTSVKFDINVVDRRISLDVPRRMSEVPRDTYRRQSLQTVKLRDSKRREIASKEDDEHKSDSMHKLASLSNLTRESRAIIYDPFHSDVPPESIIESKLTLSTHFSSVYDPLYASKSEIELNSPSIEIPADEQVEVETIREWSPMLFHMLAKFVLRWILLPIYAAFVHIPLGIFLGTYPLLVIPGSIFVYMTLIASWIYPVILRFLTSFFVVCITEITSQLLFYSMVIPLAFADISNIKGAESAIIKAILFFLSRNIVKYTVILLDRRAAEEARDKALQEKTNASEETQQGQVEVVHEDEIVNLTNLGHIILALGGNGVPGWTYVLRIESDMQFLIAAAGSLFMEAAVMICIIKFSEWLKKRKIKIKKASQAAKERKSIANRNIFVLPKSKNEKALIQNLMKNQQGLETHSALEQAQNPIVNRARVASYHGTIFPSNNAQSNVVKTGEILTKKTQDLLNNIKLASLHQNNRRLAVEKRYEMSSNYASIIGAGVVYLISIGGNPDTSLCPRYGVIPIPVLLWRLFLVLSVQFLVDWGYTFYQLNLGLPLAFTTQIETGFIQGFLMAAFSVTSASSALMAHERGLFGSC